MTPKLPKAYSEFRRQQILRAAWDSFVERGYSGTTVREIAKRIDASTGVIYNLFKGKDEILDAIQESSLEENRQMFLRLARKSTSREAVVEFFEANFECDQGNGLEKISRGNMSLWLEALRKKKIRTMLNSFYQNLEKGLSGFLKEGIDKKVIKTQVDPKVAAGFFLALILGLQLQIAVIDHLNADSYIEKVKKLVFTNIWTDSEEPPL